MKKIFILILLSTGFSHPGIAQMAGGKAFAGFAQKQDSLFNKAYEQRAPSVYNDLLAEFLVKYNRLSSADKKVFERYYINAYYNGCCLYALLNDKRAALNYLDSSIRAGYTDYQHIMEDNDLNTIRSDGRFISMVQPLRETGDYLYIIKKAGKYNAADKRDCPAFTYQPARNPNLAALRKAFNLDSIAGSGNEVSKILNLMHWIHNLIPHDGNHENPAVKNAMNMITVCKKDKRGLNCRGLATVLNECYLSLGITSRFVTCLPKDSLGVDNDCHVINMVYSTELKKWLWIDPTFDAYVMDEKGVLLSIEEVREHIINNKPLIISPDANWNHKISETKEYYLYYYMAKNLYLLECPVNSEYDLETREAGKNISYIQLLPLDYFRQSPDKTESTNTNDKTTLIKYKTNNPCSFWQAPATQN
jgi:hypothetical protein